MTPAQLLEENIGLTYRAAHLKAKKSGRMDMIEDYKQAAAEGFLKAFKAHDYDPSKGTIATFVWPWMTATMQQHVDKHAHGAISTVHAQISGDKRHNGGPIRKVGSLDAPLPSGDGTHGDIIGEETTEYERIEEILAAEQDVAALRAALPEHMGAWCDDFINGVEMSRQARAWRMARIREVLT